MWFSFFPWLVARHESKGCLRGLPVSHFFRAHRPIPRYHWCIDAASLAKHHLLTGLKWIQPQNTWGCRPYSKLHEQLTWMLKHIDPNKNPLEEKTQFKLPCKCLVVYLKLGVALWEGVRILSSHLLKKTKSPTSHNTVEDAGRNHPKQILQLTHLP